MPTARRPEVGGPSNSNADLEFADTRIIRYLSGCGCIMEVIFRTRRLQRNYEDPSRAVMDWGHTVGRRYADRVENLYEAADFHQLYDVRRLRLHPLQGSRTGEFSIYLTGRWRLIVTQGDTAQSITIEEVSNHYDD